jgi:hypothetical protein
VDLISTALKEGPTPVIRRRAFGLAPMARTYLIFGDIEGKLDVLRYAGPCDADAARAGIELMRERYRAVGGRRGSRGRERIYLRQSMHARRIRRTGFMECAAARITPV